MQDDFPWAPSLPLVFTFGLVRRIRPLPNSSRSKYPLLFFAFSIIFLWSSWWSFYPLLISPTLETSHDSNSWGDHIGSSSYTEPSPFLISLLLLLSNRHQERGSITREKEPEKYSEWDERGINSWTWVSGWMNVDLLLIFYRRLQVGYQERWFAVRGKRMNRLVDYGDDRSSDRDRTGWKKEEEDGAWGLPLFLFWKMNHGMGMHDYATWALKSICSFWMNLLLTDDYCLTGSLFRRHRDAVGK